METDSIERIPAQASTSGNESRSAGKSRTMTCAEFQRELPLIIDSGGNAEQEEHLRSCPVCHNLVADLRYIAEQAKLLVPMRDPSPRVWDEIEERLKSEGLVKSAQARRL